MLRGFKHQLANTDGLPFLKNRLNDVVNIKRHISRKRFVVTVRANGRRHFFDLNVQAIAIEGEIRRAGNHG